MEACGFPTKRVAFWGWRKAGGFRRRKRGRWSALRIANEAGPGRSGAVFTADIERGTCFALGLSADMTHLNDSPANDDTTSDLGGQRAVDLFTAECWVSVPQARREAAP